MIVIEYLKFFVPHQADSIKEGCLDPVLPGTRRVGLLVLGEPGVDRLARLVHRHPVQVGSGAGGGGRGVGHLDSEYY